MRGQRKNPRKAVQPFENKKRKIDIFKNYEANGVEKIQRKLEIFSTLISKKSRIQKSRKADYLWICIWREHFPYPSFRWLLGYSYRNETFDAFVDFGC